MQRLKLIILFIAVSLCAGAQPDPSGRVGRLSYISGPVSFQPAGVADWVNAEVNRPLTTNDQVWIGDRGRAEIHAGSTALRLDANTAFQFLNLDDQTIQVQVSQGTLTVHVRNMERDQIIEIDTPGLAFNVLRPGEYRISVYPDSQTATVTVRDGEGEVTGGSRTFAVHAGQQAISSGDEQITYRLVSAPRIDAWDQWSSSRDRREEQSLSARYVSREVGGYEDLDQYGSWSSQPGYGQVWMPGGVSAGWAPYHDGHWAWIAPWGWTWIDEAPWGFAPYHYGRWASFGGRWGWVPGPYGVTPMYAPALVAWVGGGRGSSGFSLSFSFGIAAAVAWFPLGPREPYFPSYRVSSGYFGRVNARNTVINQATINNYYNDSRDAGNSSLANIRYANQGVPNAITAVPQDRFASGRRVTESARIVTGSQLGSARIESAPEIAPQRVSVLGPRAADVSRAPRPPAGVLSRPVVARTPPPPAPVPFERQQPELNRNPGRPLAPDAVQQMRQAAPARTTPIRVEDMKSVQRVQPAVGGAPLPAGRVANPAAGSYSRPSNQQSPAAPAPVVGDRQQKGRWAAPVARPDAPAPNASPRQQNPPQPNVVPQPPANPAGRQNGRQPVATPQQQNPPRPNVVPQPPANPAGRQNGRQPVATPRQQNPPQPNVVPQPQATRSGRETEWAAACCYAAAAESASA